MGQINFRTKCPYCDTELGKVISTRAVSEVGAGSICGSCGKTIYIFLSWYGVTEIREKDYAPRRANRK